MVGSVCESEEGSQCGENVTLIPNLSVNKKTARGEPCECSACGKVFRHHSSIKRQVRCHTEHKPYDYQKYAEKPYVRKECEKALPFPSSLKIYKRTCTREKPYKCQKCSKAFTSSSSLRRHERIHTGEKL